MCRQWQNFTCLSDLQCRSWQTGSYCCQVHALPLGYTRRIYKEKKAKVVAASWGAELLQFLAELAIFHQDELKNMV